MTVEYALLGAVLILMGIVQAWLRHGPGSKDLRQERRVEPAQAGSSNEVTASRGGVRSGKGWEAWTAILGPVGIAVGIALVVLGVLGR